MHGDDALTWRSLSDTDLPAVTELARACLSADGGQPFAASSGYLIEHWVEWITEDDDFRAELTLLASLDGADAGFLVGDAAGWIAQLGVVPSARGRGIGAQLIGEAVRRMRAAGEDTITLNVNVDNPHAIALYRRPTGVAARRACPDLVRSWPGRGPGLAGT